MESSFWLSIHLFPCKISLELPFFQFQARRLTCLSTVSVSLISQFCNLDLHFSFFLFCSFFWYFWQVCIGESHRNKITGRWSTVANLLGPILIYHSFWAHFCRHSWLVNHCFITVPYYEPGCLLLVNHANIFIFAMHPQLPLSDLHN